ncbi:chitinase [Colletotrichum gloeosporioides Cg-14]|uniref:Chitinase n=1 Tax=Colletotrichum gloeosporioides (strain Cg-14) TaxID=1237896 RepID=T0M4Z2_COLGC|nr:chitinase [Colletotrichum gloeosporioides Cg-14]
MTLTTLQMCLLTLFWTKEGFDSDEGFNEHLHSPLHSVITKSGFDGADLNVENTTVDNVKIATLILRLRKDFGRSFLVTPAPGNTELIDQGGLSDINYSELEKDTGSEIDWYIAQNYNRFGRSMLEDFERLIGAGGTDIAYPPHKIVMSGMGNKDNGSLNID